VKYSGIPYSVVSLTNWVLKSELIEPMKTIFSKPSFEVVRAVVKAGPDSVRLALFTELWDIQSKDGLPIIAKSYIRLNTQFCCQYDFTSVHEPLCNCDVRKDSNNDNTQSKYVGNV